MSTPCSKSEKAIQKREDVLREWFTQGKDSIRRIIDSLDIGWGGVQRWATGQMGTIQGLHLDIACGYATFLAQLGWRFPKANLVGLNLDFSGPHKLASPLLEEAGVQAALVQADARHMPFSDGAFPSVSCFLGLQDIEIGFGEEGVKETLDETVRVLYPGGLLVLLDEFPISRFTNFLNSLSVEIIDHTEQPLDVRWTRKVAERAITLYAEGWVTQTRTGSEGAQKKAFSEIYKQMKLDMEEQIAEKGYYVPFGPICMLMARKKSGKQHRKQTT
jgi:ubiquinone/menaquinone biosynthesis C-methylase UbiE